MPAFQETLAPQIILVTGASSGFGRLAANAARPWRPYGLRRHARDAGRNARRSPT